MATNYKIEKTETRFTARNRKGEALAFICNEGEGILRVDYQMEWGWEYTRISGDFNKLTPAKAKKIFANFL